MMKWIVLVVVVCGVVYIGWQGKADVELYRFVEVEKGDVEFVVTSTGSLKAVTTVQVGTQVSGIVARIFADFNDHVKAGQIVAQIDTTLLDIAVRDAEAGLERAEAQLLYAQQNFARMSELHAQKVVTEAAFVEAQFNFSTAKAGRKSAAVSLERARRNLSYATIYAPISGTVVERNVSVGQTVAANFSAPQLFLIANDLARMQIEVSVDESDIGLIHNDQAVHFTVQAFPDMVFVGKVRQVRLQSKTEDNVVSYTVVVDVDNHEHKLLPGMTASVDFVINKVVNVLKVSNAALRFRPVEESANKEGHVMDKTAVKGKRHLRLWFVNGQNQLDSVEVRAGLSDGQMTEVVPGGSQADVLLGRKVIVGYVQSPLSDKSSSPFQQQRPRERGPRF